MAPALLVHHPLMLFTAVSLPAPEGSRIRSGRRTIAVLHWQPESLPIRDLLIVQHHAPSEEASEAAQGSIVAMVDVTAARPWRVEDLEKSARKEFEEDAFAWVLENIRPVAHARYVPIRQGLCVLDLDPKSIHLPDGALADLLKTSESAPA